MRSSLLVLGSLASLVTAFAVGCGSDETSNRDVFDCKTSSIANGSVTICEHVGATTPGKYECGPASGGTGGTGSLSLHNVSLNSDGDTSSSHDCPAGTVPQSQPPVTATGTSTGSEQTGGAASAPNTQVNVNGDGTSSTSTPVPSDQTGGAGSQSSGAPPVGSDQTGATGTPPSGGSYTCESDLTKTTCTSTNCESGYTPGPNNTCVPNAPTDQTGASGPTGTGSVGCSLTQGYWKNHASKWPVQSLTLGGKSYSQSELLAIFGKPPAGDASLILAHQLIATLLNTKNGASSASIDATIAQAQAWLSANGTTLPFGVSTTSAAGAQAVAIAKTLDDYNNGLSGVPHCD
jgi:hypothetical protein